MLYFHTVHGADAGTKINSPRGAVRRLHNIPKPHRVRAMRDAVDISTLAYPQSLPKTIQVVSFSQSINQS